MEPLRLLESNAVETGIAETKNQLLSTPNRKLKDLRSSISSSDQDITVKALNYMIDLIEGTTASVENLPKYSCTTLSGDANSKDKGQPISRPLTKEQMAGMAKDFEEHSKQRIENYQLMVSSIKNGLADISNENQYRQQQQQLLRRSVVAFKSPSPQKTAFQSERVSMNYMSTCKNKTPKKEEKAVIMPKGFSSPMNVTNGRKRLLKKEINKTFDPFEKIPKLNISREHKPLHNHFSQFNSTENQTMRPLKLTDNPFDSKTINSKDSISKSINASFKPQDSIQKKALAKLNHSVKKETLKSPREIKEFGCFSTDKKLKANVKRSPRKEAPVCITQSYSSIEENNKQLRLRNKEKEYAVKISKVKAIKPTVENNFDTISFEEVDQKERKTASIQCQKDEEANDHLMLSEDIEDEEEKMLTLPYTSRNKDLNQHLFIPSRIKHRLKSFSQPKRISAKHLQCYSFEEVDKKQKRQTCCVLGNDNCTIF